VLQKPHSPTLRGIRQEDVDRIFDQHCHAEAICSEHPSDIQYFRVPVKRQQPRFQRESSSRPAGLEDVPVSRLRRSQLITPGSSDRMLDTAAASSADVVVIDLEDAVAPELKLDARDRTARAVRELDWGAKTRAVRINPPDSEWAHGDVITLVSLAGDALDMLVLPKVRRARDVWWVETLLDQLERATARHNPVRLAVLIEEAEALQNLQEISQSTSRLEALILGTADLARSLGMRGGSRDHDSADGLVHALSRMVVAARAAGLQPVDGPFSGRLDDLVGFRQEAVRSWRAGCVGKWAVHPHQVPILNEEFSPSREEAEDARLVLGAYEQARADGRGAARHQGRMIDHAHARAAEALLETIREIDAHSGSLSIGDNLRSDIRSNTEHRDGAVSDRRSDPQSADPESAS
jgi:citrate lyase subunit beta / citryl-CoA lyase